MNTPIYADFAAATPVDDAAIAAMQPYMSDTFYNPSAIYQPAREVRAQIETARADVASVLGARDQEVIFTAGGTEANNMAIHGVMSQYPEGELLVSAIEHESVLEPAKQYTHQIIPVTSQGVVDVNATKSRITPSTVLISVMYANNEIGTIQPIKALTELVNSVRTQRKASGNTMPLFLHTDACQAANYLDLHVSRLGVDMMTLNGGKIYGIKQSGCLYVQKTVRLTPLVFGGGQESSIRSGTENVGSIIAFATMLQKVQSDRKAESERLQQLTVNLFATISQTQPNVALNGALHKRLPNNLNVVFPRVDGERLVMELDEAGLLCATGSACTASNDEPSHVLLALGMSAAEASASIRLTFGRSTTKEQIDQVAIIISDTVQKHQKLL